MYNPVIFYNTAKRIGQPPGSSEQPALFALVIFDNKIAGDIPSGASVLWLDACGQPCAPDNAMYVVYPQGYAPPAGFSFAWGAGEMAPSYWAQQFQYPPNILGGSPASKVANALPASSKEGKPTTAESPHTTAPADAEAEVFTLVEGESGYHVQSSRSKKLEPATNFLIRISRVVHIVHADHEHDEREIELQITVFAGTMLNRSLTLPYEKIKDILSYIQQKIGEAIIFSSVKVAFLNRFPEHFRQKLAIAPHQYFIESSGWNRLPGGSFAYVHDAAVPRERNVLYRTDFSIPNAQLLLSPADALQNAWKMLRLASKPAKILIPFLFAHLGCMWSLFSEAGYPPRTILFIRGTTGSLKTAVASLLFNFSAIPENNVPATFRDTSASMEVKMGQFRDRVLLVDDFCPAASGASQGHATGSGTVDPFLWRWYRSLQNGPEA